MTIEYDMYHLIALIIKCRKHMFEVDLSITVGLPTIGHLGNLLNDM